MSSSGSAGNGGRLAGAGALVLLGSLWLTWYTVSIPDELRQMFKGIGKAAPSKGTSPGEEIGQAFAGAFSGLLAAIPDEISASGWRALDGADVALTVIAALALVIALALAAASPRLDRKQGSQGLAALGALALVIVGYNAVSPPGGSSGFFAQDLMEVRYGLGVAGLGSLMLLAGGLLAGRPTPGVAAVQLAPDVLATPFGASDSSPARPLGAVPQSLDEQGPPDEGSAAGPTPATGLTRPALDLIAPPAPSGPATRGVSSIPRDPGSTPPPGWPPSAA